MFSALLSNLFRYLGILDTKYFFEGVFTMPASVLLVVTLSRKFNMFFYFKIDAIVTEYLPSFDYNIGNCA